MRFSGFAGGFALCLIVAQGVVLAQWEAPERPRSNFMRWTGSADWEYYSTSGETDGGDNTFDAFRQRYSLGLDGSLWDPRLNRFSLGLDWYLTDRKSNGATLDSENLGYRALGTLFPNRPFPLTLFARRSTTNVTGATLSASERDTSAWGIEWNLAGSGTRKMRLLFNRTSYEVLSPLILRERKKIGVFDYNRKFGNSEITFRYDLHEEKEQVNNTAFDRQEFSLTERTRFDGGATLLQTLHYTDSKALFNTGQRDKLTASRGSINFELPPGSRLRTGFNYVFNENQGQFVDSASHTFRTYTRFRWNPHWESLGSLNVGRIDTASPTGLLEQRFVGAGTGVRYGREWTRVSLRTSYSIGYDETRFNTEPDRQTLTQFAEVTTQFALRSDEEAFITLSRTLDDNDTTGVGYTYDENRLTAGWQRRLNSAWRGRASATYRESVRDTFQYGLQESDGITIAGSLSHPLGGFSLALSSTDGISNFFPDPTSNSPLLPGSDLVNDSEVALVGAHWRFWRSFRVHMQLRYENRFFTTIGKEEILSYHPRLDYDLHSWRFSAGYSHYERTNGTELLDDTWIVKVTRRFF